MPALDSPFVSANQLILDYFAICEKRGAVLDLQDFAKLWRVADGIANGTAADDRERMLRLILDDPD